MAVKLSGTLADITTRPIKEVTTVTIKAPYYRVGTQITTSQPEKVDVDASGSFSVSVTEGVGYLYIEGPGWSDSIKFLAAAGMKTIVEAIANAAGVPGMVDFLRLISATDGEIAKRAAEAVKAAATDIRFQKGFLKDGDNLNDFGDSGAWDHTFITGKTVANLPLSKAGVLYVFAGTDGGTNKVVEGSVSIVFLAASFGCILGTIWTLLQASSVLETATGITLLILMLTFLSMALRHHYSEWQIRERRFGGLGEFLQTLL